jgi:hypothetical protein
LDTAKVVALSPRAMMIASQTRRALFAGTTALIAVFMISITARPFQRFLFLPASAGN